MLTVKNLGGCICMEVINCFIMVVGEIFLVQLEFGVKRKNKKISWTTIMKLFTNQSEFENSYLSV